jgi:hypothetical protein
MQALIRKAGHVLDDPVLRRWLVRRAVGLEKPPPAFTAGQPPYLGAHGDHVPTKLGASAVMDFPTGKFLPPSASIRIDLAGTTVDLAPEKPTALFAQPYEDLETLLAAHRFAWVPVAGVSVDADWVALLWQTWISGFGDVTSGWPWHAYTAAERAINIIDFSRRFGLPGDLGETCQILARHADIIRGNLEYFGEHYTSNHLSNNGRGLLRIGTALGRADHAEAGAQIMVAEAGRIFGRSGVLREGSTHYHLLITRNYIDAWLEAQAAGLDAADLLRDIVLRALAVIPSLCLPGGMPLIGDISPDIPPACLGFFFGDRGGEGWLASLRDDRRYQARDLISASAALSPDKLAEDGWHRFGAHDWQALVFASPDGWPPMPGHGHEDLGSFELHHGTTRVIVDPGRGTYADADDERAQAHSGILIDGRGPMPVNRAYYSPAYRNRIIPGRPEMARSRSGRVLEYAGSGYGRQIGAVERSWGFTDNSVEICDRIEGRGRHRISQRFIVPGIAEVVENSVMISIGGKRYEISGPVPAASAPCTIWEAYGCGNSATAITFDQAVTFPFEGIIKIDQL